LLRTDIIQTEVCSRFGGFTVAKLSEHAFVFAKKETFLFKERQAENKRQKYRRQFALTLRNKKQPRINRNKHNCVFVSLDFVLFLMTNCSPDIMQPAVVYL